MRPQVFKTVAQLLQNYCLPCETAVDTGLEQYAQHTLTMRCPCCTVVRTLADLRSRCHTLLACRYLTACSICHISSCTSSEDSWPLQWTSECQSVKSGALAGLCLGWGSRSFPCSSESLAAAGAVAL